MTILFWIKTNPGNVATQYPFGFTSSLTRVWITGTNSSMYIRLANDTNGSVALSGGDDVEDNMIPLAITVDSSGNLFLDSPSGRTAGTTTISGDKQIAYIGRGVSAYGTQTMGNVLMLHSAMSRDRYLEYYNNPDKFIQYAVEDSSDSDDRCYPLTEGYYPNEGLVLDYLNKKHGTFEGPSDAASNGLETGYQAGLSSLNRYYFFDKVDDQIIIPSQDLANETVTIDFASTSSDEQQIFQIQDPTNDYEHSLTLNIATGEHVFQSRQIATSTQDFNVEAPGASLEPSNRLVVVFNSDGLPTSATFNGVAMTTSVRNGRMNTASSTGIYVGRREGGNFEFKGVFTLFQVGSVDLLEDLSGATINGSPEQIEVFPTSPIGSSDYLGRTIQFPWNNGFFNFIGGRHGGMQLASALGNVRTLAFAIKVTDASTNQNIWDLGTPVDITLTSSAIACAAFSSIVVDGSGNTITDDTWHYVELQNATDVNIDQTGKLLFEGFEGQIVPLIAYSGQLSAEDSTRLRNFVNSIP